jgi:hypothetical protein
MKVVEYWHETNKIVDTTEMYQTTTWRQDDGDHGVKPMTMEIMLAPQDGDQRREVMMAISCH